MKIPKGFYCDLGSSTALLLRSSRFRYDSCRFDRNLAESPSSGMGFLQNIECINSQSSHEGAVPRQQ